MFAQSSSGRWIRGLPNTRADDPLVVWQQILGFDAANRVTPAPDDP